MDTLTVPPPPSQPYLRIVPLGGCGEIGRNMTVIETNDDLVVVDCGLMFPDDEMYGVDIVINDFTYLRERRDKLRALLVTHGHEDHIGGIPYFSARVSHGAGRRHAAVARADQSQVARAAQRRDASSRKCSPATACSYGAIEAEFVHINHSVAGACALAIRTPVGTIFHTGDFKFDQTPIDGKPADFASIARVGDEGVLCMLSRLDQCGTSGTHALRAHRRRSVYEHLLARQGAHHRRVVRIERAAHSAGRRPCGALRPQGRVSRPLAAQRRAFRRRARLSAHSVRIA